jgi:hypothetical protein
MRRDDEQANHLSFQQSLSHTPIRELENNSVPEKGVTPVY